MSTAAASRRYHPADRFSRVAAFLPQARNAQEVYQPFRECGFVHCGKVLYPGRTTGHEVISMFEPIQTNPERARVRLRDLGAAWVLVALIVVATVLPGALRAAKTEAVEAAGAARCEVATVWHAVPKLLQHARQA